MGDNNEEIYFTDVVVAQPTITDQNELIMQLRQQIVYIRVEIEIRQDLPLEGFTINASTDGRPPLYSSSPNMEQVQKPPSTPAQNSSVIDISAQNPQYS